MKAFAMGLALTSVLTAVTIFGLNLAQITMVEATSDRSVHVDDEIKSSRGYKP